MPKKKVILLDEVPFKTVAWGRTKIFIGPQANGAEHIRVGVTEYDPETPHEPHAHPGQEEVIWVLSGKGYTETHGERIDLAPGAVAGMVRLPKGGITLVVPLNRVDHNLGLAVAFGNLRADLRMRPYNFVRRDLADVVQEARPLR